MDNGVGTDSGSGGGGAGENSRGKSGTTVTEQQLKAGREVLRPEMCFKRVNLAAV